MVRLVYCQKCGAQNEDDAINCKSCGAPLRPPTYTRARRRFEEDACFGTKGGIPIWGVVFGLLIVLWGVTSLLGNVYSWASWDRLWPLFVIAIGLLIIFNVLSRR